MEDLISRQAAIDALVTPRIYDVYDSYWNGRNKQHQEDIDAIKALPSAQPEPNWIPCRWHTEKENLPQECKSVLVCVKGNWGYQIGVSYRTDYNRWEGFGRVNVIAWMPLPEPWKGDNNGG